MTFGLEVTAELVDFVLVVSLEVVNALVEFCSFQKHLINELVEEIAVLLDFLHALLF